MPLTLSPLLPADVPAFVRIEAAAAVTWPFALAMETPGTRREVFVEEWAHRTLRSEENAIFLKVVDSETGEMVSAAMWKIPVQQQAGVEKGEGKEESVDTGEKKSVVEEEEHAAIKPTADVGMVVSGSSSNSTQQHNSRKDVAAFFALLETSWQDFEASHIGSQPYALLQLLVTHPGHRRRGAGSLLVRWGCTRADSLGLLAALSASAAGEALYVRHGFEVKRREEMDLGPWGVDELVVRARMLRVPRAAEATRGE